MNTTTPIVSVCLPVYNGARYLAKALDSVLAQTHQDFELLIADDCSTDSSAAIIEKYAKQDPRIKAWKNETNLGHYGNYNACLRKASGKYIKLFAQDDILHPRIIERFVSVLNDNSHIVLVNCARIWIDASGQTIKVKTDLDKQLTKPFVRDTTLSGDKAIVSTLKDATNWLGEPSSQMFRSEFLSGGFDESFRQIGDLEYNYRLLQNGDYRFIADELCYFRKHGGSWTTTNSRELSTYLEWLLLASKYTRFLVKAGYSAEEYCLKFLKDWMRNLEETMHQTNKISEKERGSILRELCGHIDPLSLFSCQKNAERKHLEEFRAMSAIALLQGSLLEHELRLVGAEAARPYTDERLDNDDLSELRPGIAAALYGLKQTLLERDKEIAALRSALNEMGDSVSWKLTEPLRKLKGRIF
jgi:glycosyltransferase involved in cell wall biosynthesis